MAQSTFLTNIYVLQLEKKKKDQISIENKV